MNMKKVYILLVLLIAVLLSGCSEGTIYFEGNQRPVDDVEEIIADKLEVENPDLDLEVDIYEESE